MQPLRDYPFAARPMIVAHRGDTTLGAAENSSEAIAAALISGADMIEVDVQASKDGEFFCYHDRTLPGHGAPLSELDTAELVRAGVTPLTAVMEQTRGQAYLNLEIKEYSARDPHRFMDSLAKLVAKAKLEEHVLVSSFRFDYIRSAGWTLPTVIIRPDSRMMQFFAANSHHPAAPLPQPVEQLLPSDILKLSGAVGFACQLDEITPEAEQDIRRHNILLSVYTITTEPEFDRALALGARALVCERPSEFAALRNHRFPLL